MTAPRFRTDAFPSLRLPPSTNRPPPPAPARRPASRHHSEFGPRALGNRSLIADPRGPETKDRVNRIKQREPFRPFAPVIMAQFADRYFDMPVADSPYMQFVAPVKRPDLFPAIAHFDNTARVQTVRREQHPLLYDLLSCFHEKTGCPMLLNTSLNVKGEPLVNVWEDAMRFQALHGVKIF
jgi:carbamoyltransferase